MATISLDQEIATTIQTLEGRLLQLSSSGTYDADKVRNLSQQLETLKKEAMDKSIAAQKQLESEKNSIMSRLDSLNKNIDNTNNLAS